MRNTGCIKNGDHFQFVTDHAVSLLGLQHVSKQILNLKLFLHQLKKVDRCQKI